eukprot:Clim_evm30s201 gene=Clim_evmTU30s201
MSADLTWEIVKRNNCFLRRSHGRTFTVEPNNVKGDNTYKCSGLANKKTVDVVAAPGDSGVVLRTKRNKVTNKPNKLITEQQFGKKSSKNSRRVLSRISKQLEDNHYRPDLKRAVLGKASAILRAQRARATKA